MMDNPHVEEFKDQCQECSGLQLTLGRAISSISTVSASERSEVIKRARERVRETTILLRNMENKLQDVRRSVSTSEYNEYKRQFNNYKSDLQHQKDNLNRSINRNDFNKLKGKDKDQRQSVLRINETTNT
eukprot:UN02146